MPANPIDEGANTASRKADIYDSVTGVTCQCRDCQRGEVNEAVETFFLQIVLMLLVSCNYPTPKMACEDELETLAVECNMTLASFARSGSSYSENLSLLLCARYTAKKVKCQEELY